MFFQVEAIDNDLGDNGRLTYTIESAQDIFEVNKVTGELFALVNLDREIKDRYMIQIKASDSGSEKQLFSIVNVEITIKDINDNLPEFYPVDYFLDLKSKPFTNLVASDLDENSKVTFELENQEPEFEIDSELGIVKANPRYSSLLRSEGTKRILKVFAIDNDGKKSPRPGQVQVFPNNRLTGTTTKNGLFRFRY